jgi:hypothetical protein
VVDGKYYYSAKDVGKINVSDDIDGTVYFRINEKRYAPEDVVKLFSTYVGGNLIYQQVDSCDDVLEEDMMLMPMRIDADTLVQDLNDILFAMTDNHEGKLIGKKMSLRLMCCSRK